MDESQFYECDDCGRRFRVVWDRDDLHLPIEHCPFCGNADVVRDGEPDDDD